MGCEHKLVAAIGAGGFLLRCDVWFFGPFWLLLFVELFGMSVASKCLVLFSAVCNSVIAAFAFLLFHLLLFWLLVVISVLFGFGLFPDNLLGVWVFLPLLPLMLSLLVSILKWFH